MQSVPHSLTVLLIFFSFLGLAKLLFLFPFSQKWHVNAICTCIYVKSIHKLQFLSVAKKSAYAFCSVCGKDGRARR